MKKLTSLILTLGVILTLSACNDNTNSSVTDSGSSSEASSAISSEASSESEAELTFDEKFRGLDQELRYDEVIELLGEPDKKGGENVKYLSYKQDDGKSAIVQFLYGDNPRIDYTYITDSETKEEEILLHRRICDHEKGYCSFDIHYSEEMHEFIDKCKKVKQGMTRDEVVAILGEPADEAGGTLNTYLDYFPDDYHRMWVCMNYTADDDGMASYKAVEIILWDKLSLIQAVNILPENDGNDSKKKPLTELEQDAYVQKVSETQLITSLKEGVKLKDYLIDYIGVPDDEINYDDVTKYVYKLSDGTLAHICVNNKEAEPTIEYAFVYNPETKKVIKNFYTVTDCSPGKYFTDIAEN